MSNTDKDAELRKYRELVVATLDYYIERKENQKNPAFQNLNHHFIDLRSQTEELFQKGRLSTLKKWFHDLTEISVETRDLKFNEYLKNKTNYDIDIFKSFKNRIEKLLKQGRIKSDNQYYDIKILVDQISLSTEQNSLQIEELNQLLSDYEERKKKRKL